MQQPQFFIGQDVVFLSDGYGAAVRILGAQWDADANDWHYRYQASNEHDGWFYEANATHFVPLAQDWESIEAQTKSANVYAINS